MRRWSTRIPGWAQGVTGDGRPFAIWRCARCGSSQAAFEDSEPLRCGFCFEVGKRKETRLSRVPDVEAWAYVESVLAAGAGLGVQTGVRLRRPRRWSWRRAGR
jgi:hypothetical protein